MLFNVHVSGREYFVDVYILQVLGIKRKSPLGLLKIRLLTIIYTYAPNQMWDSFKILYTYFTKDKILEKNHNTNFR